MFIICWHDSHSTSTKHIDDQPQHQVAHCKACRVHLCPTRTSASLKMNAGGNWGKDVSSPTRPNSPGWKMVKKILFLVQINSNDSSPRGCHQFPLVISCSCFVTKICQGLGKESLVNIHDLAITMRSWIVGNAMIWCELSAAFSYRCSKWTGFPFQWISWFLLPRQRESCPHGNWALMLLERFC